MGTKRRSSKSIRAKISYPGLISGWLDRKELNQISDEKFRRRGIYPGHTEAWLRQEIPPGLEYGATREGDFVVELSKDFDAAAFARRLGLPSPELRDGFAIFQAPAER